MKFIHLADLHLGKKVFGYDLEEEQQDVLRQVLELADQREADGVLICGDVFDTAAPPVNAVELFDWFLSELYQRSLDVFIISGNHDSPAACSLAAGFFPNPGFTLPAAGMEQLNMPTWKRTAKK